MHTSPDQAGALGQALSRLVCLSLHHPFIYSVSLLSSFSHSTCHWFQRWTAHLLLFCVFFLASSPAPGT